MTDNLTDSEFEEVEKSLTAAHAGIRSKPFPAVHIFEKSHMEQDYTPMMKYLYDYYVGCSYTQRQYVKKRGREGDPGWRQTKKRKTRFKVKTTQRVLRSFG